MNKKLVNRSSLVDNICEYLSNAISSFQLRPGEAIDESALIQELGVSRSPVREAIRLLEGEGLVERVPHKGVFVCKATSQEIQESFPIRAIIEGMAAAQAVRNMRDSDLASIESTFQKMEQAIRENNSKQYAKLNFEFHRKFIKFAKNTTIEQVLKTLGRRSAWILFTLFSTSQSMELSHQEHVRILAALKKRDPQLAAETVRIHIERGQERVLAAFQKGETSDHAQMELKGEK